MGSNKGALIAQTALTYPDKDTRSYGANPPNVDCSMFVSEVFGKLGVLLPREASAQAAWFKKNGSLTTTFNEAQVGDTAYWDRGAGKYHTGIIVQVTPEILVVHATTFKNQPNCIRKNVVLSTGIIRYWTFKFIGLGRLK